MPDQLYVLGYRGIWSVLQKIIFKSTDLTLFELI